MARDRAIIFLRVALACFLIVSLFGTFANEAYAASFGVGDTVQVTTNLNVRTGPGTSYPEITDPDYPGYAPAGTQGQVLDGPTSADGYIWWKVDFGPGLYSGWSVEGGLEKVAAATVAARIDSYSPSSLVGVTVGGSTTISVTFTNTGNTAWNFIAGATVWDSGGNQVANYSKTLSSALQPSQQTTVSWTYPVNQAGDYWLQFGVWKATPYTSENLLDKKPSPSQNLIRGVAPPQPTIDYSPSSFSFSATQGGSNPSSQTLSIRNSGGGTLNWSVSDDAGWLSFSPTNGTSTGETDSVAVAVSISGMSAGSYGATITISASGATNTPQTMPVNLTINSSTTISARIDSYSPSSLVEVTVGGSTTISVSFTNTGNTAWNFIAGATVWDSSGSQVANYSKTLSSALQPGQQTTVSWPHPVNQAGDYWLQFGVWKATPYTVENLLDKKPSPSQNLIRGVVAADQLPTCSISANPRSGNAPLTVTFSISASDPDGAISAWVLDVDGDGNADYSGTGAPPSTKTHTYNNLGSYSVVLMVSDNEGTNASDTETVNVGSVNQPPTCSLSANQRSGSAPLTVTFSMSASDSDGSISSWALDADGDGNTDYSGSGSPPSTQGHIYANPGNYTAVLMVSDNDDATASDTETISVTQPSLPDLAVTDIQVDPSPPTAGGSTTIGITITNQGGSDATGTFFLEFYFDGTYQGHVYVDGLAVGSSRTSYWQAHTWPSDTNPHTIKGVVDPDNTISESKESNNELSEQFMAAVNQPDLVIAGITWSPASPSIGDTVTFTVTIKNQGTTRAGSSKVYYFIDNVQQGYDYVSSIDPDATTLETFTWKTQEGSHAVKAAADHSQEVAESDEANNEKTVTFSATALSDLIIEGITWSSASPSIGDTVTFTVTIKNQGTGKASTSKVYYFIDNAQQGYDYVDSIDPGATATETFTWKAQDGPHAIKAVADYEGQVTENDESNNERIITFSAMALSDLTIESITWLPTSPSIGDTVTFTVTIKNQGSGKAGSFKVYYFIDDVQQGYDSVYSLDQNATVAETFTWNAKEGSHTVKAVADYNDDVVEGDETNNKKTITVGPSGVLAKINSHSPAAPLEVHIGEPITLGVTFTNTGNTSWMFYAAASLRRPDDTEEHLRLKPVSLTSGEQGSATWSYTIDADGAWDIVFGVWREQEQVNSLDHTGWLNDYIICIKADDTAPRVNSLSIQPNSITQGDSFTIACSVSDTGGSGLNRVELWRANDSNGSPVDWVEITRTSASGSSDSGSLTDDPSSAGFYWYGIHVADNAGNWATEDSPVKVEVKLAPVTSVLQYTLTVPFNKLGSIALDPTGESPAGRPRFVISSSTGNLESSIFYYKAGTEVTLTAKPVLEDYVFAHWGGGYVTGNRNPETVVMDSDKSVTAYFQQITSGLEVANFDYWSELIALREALHGVLAQARGKLRADEEQELSLLTRADALISKIERGQSVRYPLREGGPTNTHRVINEIVGWLLGFPQFLNESVEALSEAVGESLELGELGLLNIKEAGQGVIYIAYKKDSREIWVNINLYDPVGRIYMFIPVEVESKEILVPEWEHDWLPGSPKAMMTTGSALEIRMTPTMDDIRLFYGRDALVIVAESPVEIRVYDSQGWVTGIVNGEVKEEIPNSGYYENTVTILSPSDSYSYEVIGTGDGSYGLTITSIAEETTNSFSVADAPISTRAVHQYTVDWDALYEGKKGVTMKIDADGDGTFEDVKYLGQEGIGFSWVWVAVVGLSALLGVLVGAFMVWRRIGKKQAA